MDDFRTYFFLKYLISMMVKITKKSVMNKNFVYLTVLKYGLF